MAASRNLLLVTLAFAVLASGMSAAPVRAASQSVTLFGHAATGWGTSNATISDPGPPLSGFVVGDTITITIWANDSVPHNWFIDYNDDNTADTGEPATGNIGIGGVATVTVSLTLDRVGTFTYRCGFHPGTMTGTITISAAPTPPSDNTLLIVGGVIAVVIIVAAAAMMMRRKPKLPSQPPTQP